MDLLFLKQKRVFILELEISEVYYNNCVFLCYYYQERDLTSNNTLKVLNFKIIYLNYFLFLVTYVLY